MTSKVSPKDETRRKEAVNILYKYTERLVRKEARAINDFIGGYIPKWQARVMLKFPFLIPLFGWEIVKRHNWNYEADKFGQKIELKRRGKLVATLTII